MEDKNEQIPITQLSKSSIEEVMREDNISKQTAFAYCNNCEHKWCDYCKNALRTGKRRVKS